MPKLQDLKESLAIVFMSLKESPVGLKDHREKVVVQGHIESVTLRLRGSQLEYGFNYMDYCG